MSASGISVLRYFFVMTHGASGEMTMLKSQKLQLEMSEKRQAINALQAQEEYEIDDLDRMNGEYRELEIRFQSALIEEAAEVESTPTDDLDSEKVEIRRLEEGVEIRNYFEAALNDNPLVGKEAELESALGIAGVGTQVPWIALLSPEERVEARAATTAPSDSDVVVANILGRVFANGAGAYLGVNFPAVPVGAANYPVLSSGVAPANVEGSGAANETAATLTANVLDPVRLSASYRMRVEDLNKLRMMEDALRADLQGAMTEAADAQIVSGDGTAPNVSGFNSALTAATDPTETADFAAYASARAKLVDGRYAENEDAVKILVGASTYQHAAAIFQTGSGTSALSRLMPRVSPHIPAAASNIQAAIASRSQGRAVAPMWPSISIIRDSVSAASKGEVVITAIALWAFKVLDVSGYSALKFKLA